VTATGERVLQRVALLIGEVACNASAGRMGERKASGDER
jgi:hypothetical protein